MDPRVKPEGDKGRRVFVVMFAQRGRRALHLESGLPQSVPHVRHVGRVLVRLLFDHLDQVQCYTERFSKCLVSALRLAELGARDRQVCIKMKSGYLASTVPSKRSAHTWPPDRASISSDRCAPGSPTAARCPPECSEAEFARDLLDVAGLALEGEGRMAGDHEQVAVMLKFDRDVFRDRVREVTLIGIIARVDERQHGDRRLFFGSGKISVPAFACQR